MYRFKCNVYHFTFNLYRFTFSLYRFKFNVSRYDEDDELVVIAEDNDTYKPEEKHQCSPGRPPERASGEGVQEFIFFAGWRRDLRDIILLLDAMCAEVELVQVEKSVSTYSFFHFSPSWLV